MSQHFYKVNQNQFGFNLPILKFFKLFEIFSFLLHTEFNFFQFEKGKGKRQIGWTEKAGVCKKTILELGSSRVTTSVDLVTMHVPKIDGQNCFSSLCHWHELSFLKTSCHVRKIGKSVEFSIRRWQKYKSHSKYGNRRSAIREDGKNFR